jgi:ribosomal protein S18 acetylase RimI-like enzyme
VVERSAAFTAQLESVKAYARLMAGGTATSWLYEQEGITASVCSAAPDQSMANVVTYGDPDRLLSGLAGLERAYRAAEVRAWQLWEWSGTDRAALEEAGYRHVGHMPGMTIELEDLAPVRLGGFTWNENDDMEIVGIVNQATYANGDGLATSLARVPPSMSVRVYETLWEGKIGAVVCMVYPPGDDVTGFFLATHPDARGHEIGRKLYVAALRDAQHRGYKTASLQASEVGAPIYRDVLGFEPVAPELFQVYEWKRPESA